MAPAQPLILATSLMRLLEKNLLLSQISLLDRETVNNLLVLIHDLLIMSEEPEKDLLMTS
jgi:hypothetical protein